MRCLLYSPGHNAATTGGTGAMRRLVATCVVVVVAAVGLPACLTLPGYTSQISLVSSSVVSGYRYDFYRNTSYRCAISGYQTFVVVRPDGSSTSAPAPLWVVMHGDGVGWFNSSGVPKPDSSLMTEESAAGLRNQLFGSGVMSSVLSSHPDFRLMAVSYCDRDLYSGTDSSDTNNPNLESDGSVHRTNGLQATKAAIQFATRAYSTSKYFLHGLGDGAIGAYLAAYTLQLQ